MSVHGMLEWQLTRIAQRVYSIAEIATQKGQRVTCESHVTNMYTRAITQDPLLLQATFLRGTSAPGQQEGGEPSPGC